MINLPKLYAWTNYLKTKFDRINNSQLIINQTDLKNIFEDLQDNDYPFAAVVLPSTKGDARDEDNYGEINQILVFILSPTKESETYDSWYNDILLMSTAIEDMKADLRDQKALCDQPFNSIFKGLDLNSFHTDPERNFLGHDGWSVSFKVKTMGY